MQLPAAGRRCSDDRLNAEALEHFSRRTGRRVGMKRWHSHLLRDTFACLYLRRYCDPVAIKSPSDHPTQQMTNHSCEAVQQMDVVRADTTSILDGLDTRMLDINRRGRFKRDVRRERPA